MATIPSHEADSAAGVSAWKELLALLVKAQGYYSAILDITDQENGKLTRGRPLTEVMALLKKKKILVACIDEIDTMLSPLRSEWQKSKDDSPLCTIIQEKVDELNATLKATLDLDMKNQILMKRQLAVLKAQASQAPKTTS